VSGSRQPRTTITKLDAAKSQLATAIRLYFEDCDPVSVHTLVMAASEIINRLCESKGITPMRSTLLTMIIPGHRKEISDHLNKARNFFKHAEASRPDEILEDFSDELNLIGIMMSIHGLLLLGVDVREANIFATWSMLVKPEFFLSSYPKELMAAFDPMFDPEYFRSQPRAWQKLIGLRLTKECQRVGGRP